MDKNVEFHSQCAGFHDTHMITPPLRPKMAEEQLFWSHVFNISYREESSISPTGNVDSTPMLKTPPTLTHTRRYLCWKMFPAVSSLVGGVGSLC